MRTFTSGRTRWPLLLRHRAAGGTGTTATPRGCRIIPHTPTYAPLAASGSRLYSSLPEEISPSDAAHKLQRKEIRILDVRDPAELVQGARFSHALNVPLSQIEDAAEFLDKDGSLVTVCASGMRSAAAAKALSSRGFRVHSLRGGMNSVCASPECAPMLMGKVSKVWSIERQVRLVAGALTATGTLLGAMVSPTWLLLPGFVGSGLVWSAVSNTCGMGVVLQKMPWNKR